MLMRIKGRSGLVALFLPFAALMVAAAACGTDSGTDGVAAGAQKIRSTDTIYSADNLLAAGFKQSKDYDVAGLEGATAAIYGFFGPDPYNRKEYEARFYASQEDAVNLGVSFADEATGPEAVVAESQQRWKVGLTERRECQGNVAGSHHSGKCDAAKYGDYMIAGNMILLCQGKDAETARANCNALLTQLQ